jgi:hypothetical protein
VDKFNSVFWQCSHLSRTWPNKSILFLWDNLHHKFYSFTHILLVSCEPFQFELRINKRGQITLFKLCGIWNIKPKTKKMVCQILIKKWDFFFLSFYLKIFQNEHTLYVRTVQYSKKCYPKGIDWVAADVFSTKSWRRAFVKQFPHNDVRK